MTQEIPFEKAFARLEEILEKMNSGELALDDSLKLYEEADRLITSCNQRLQKAEQRIEILVKNREGQVQTDHAGNPRIEEFDSTP